MKINGNNKYTIVKEDIMREKITQTAEKLFTTKGYYQTSMDDIANEAGVAKGSLYYHFKNKSQLFCETVIAGLDYFTKKTVEIYHSTTAADVMAQKIIALLVSIYYENESIANIVMADVSTDIEEEDRKKIQDAKDKYINFIAMIIRDGINSRLIVQCDPNLTANAVVSFVHSYAKCAKKADPTKSDSKVVSEISSLILKGLSR